MPIGVIAGSERYMGALDGGEWRYGDDSFPEIGVTYFAGTFVRHPLAMAAADAVTRHLEADAGAVQAETMRRGDEFADLTEPIVSARQGRPCVSRTAARWRTCTSRRKNELSGLLTFHLRHRGVHIWDHRPIFVTPGTLRRRPRARARGVLRQRAGAAGGRLPLRCDGGGGGHRARPARPVSIDCGLHRLGLHRLALRRSEVPSAGGGSRRRRRFDPHGGADRRSRSYPVMDAQSEIWLASQLDADGSRAFHENLVLRLEGPLHQRRAGAVPRAAHAAPRSAADDVHPGRAGHPALVPRGGLASRCTTCQGRDRALEQEQRLDALVDAHARRALRARFGAAPSAPTSTVSPTTCTS